MRNTLDKSSVKMYGLHERPGEGKQPLEIAAGDIREVRFRLTAPGTYHYWATTTSKTIFTRGGVDSQLSGALVVDPPGEAVADRVFVMGLWNDRPLPGSSQPAGPLARDQHLLLRPPHAPAWRLLSRDRRRRRYR